MRFTIPLNYDNLVRTRYTRPQVELSGSERAENVRGAFNLIRPAEVYEKRILLIDDVFTTGATMNECAKVLKNAGAAIGHRSDPCTDDRIDEVSASRCVFHCIVRGADQLQIIYNVAICNKSYCIKERNRFAQRDRFDARNEAD